MSESTKILTDTNLNTQTKDNLTKINQKSSHSGIENVPNFDLTQASRSHIQEPVASLTNAYISEHDTTLPDILSLKIHSPNNPFNSDSITIEIQVSPQEIVQEIHSILQTEYSETCHRTCFSLHFNSQRLDSFCEIGNIEGIENDSHLIVVEEPYTFKEAKNHIKHVRNLIRGLDSFDSTHGEEFQSFSFTSQLVDCLKEDQVVPEEQSGTNTNIASSPPQSSKNNKKKNKKKTREKQKQVTSPRKDFSNFPKFQKEDLLKLAQERNLPVEQLSKNFEELSKYFESSQNQSFDSTPPEYAKIQKNLAAIKEPSLMNYFPSDNKSKSDPGSAGFYDAHEFLKHFSISAWNPPPRNRQLVGDLLYIDITSIEGKCMNITGSRKGWFINNSTKDKFDPSSQGTLFNSLVSLLSNTSNCFKKSLLLMKSKKANRHVFERLPTSYQTYSWIGKPESHQDHHPLDPVKLDEMFCNRLQQEEHIPGQTRDWNEEIQTTKEMPSETQTDRILRDRSNFKSHTDFVAAASRGAVMVVDGAISALNPIAPQKNQMFLWNHIFFSFAFDCTNHFEKVGGDSAAHVSPGQDLQGIKLFNQCEVEGLYTIGTVIIDYRGYRVVCQSVIPGILEREHDESVNYGSNDYGKTISWDKFYVERLKTVSEKLKLDTCSLLALPASSKEEKENPNFIPPSEKQQFKLPTSVETKGILGSDKRHYLIDLQRVLPPDINFMDETNTGGLEPKATLKCGGFFPLSHPHKVPEHRKELLDSFVTGKYHHFMNVVYKEIESRKRKIEKMARLAAEENQTSTDKTENKEKYSLSDEDQVAILKKAAETVNSLSEYNLDIRFSADCVSPVVEIAESSDKLEQKRVLLRQLSYYLINRTIPKLVADLYSHAALPLDGKALVELIHSKGVPVRYLGYIRKKLQDKAIEESKINEASRRNYLAEPNSEVILLEMINRSVKHIFRGFIQSLDLSELAPAIAHFLNCYLSNVNKEKNLPSGDYGCNRMKEGMLGNSATPKKTPTNKQKSLTKSANKTKTNNFSKRSSESSSPSVSSDSSRNSSPERPSDSNQTIANKNMALTGHNRLGRWVNLTSQKLWKEITKEIQNYFGHELNLHKKEKSQKYLTSIDHFLITSFPEGHRNKKTALLKSFCVENGIQIACKDYNYSSSSNSNNPKPPFTVNDILDVFPKAKFNQPEAIDAEKCYNEAWKKFCENDIKNGMLKMHESLGLVQHVYGPLHGKAMKCMRELAKKYYMSQDFNEAVTMQHRATIMCERLFGFDSSKAVEEMLFFALYLFIEQLPASLALLYRIRYLVNVMTGNPEHPILATVDANIGIALHMNKDFSGAISYFNNSLSIFDRYYGGNSIKAAICHHLIAKGLESMNEFRKAIDSEKEACLIYEKIFGETHEKTKDSYKYKGYLRGRYRIRQLYMI